jgi:hypothetical protein
MGYTCPVCGYPDLTELPRGEATGGSYEICPSCGIQFGYSDEAGGDAVRRQAIYEKWRQQWIEKGMLWRSIGIKQPPDWNPKEQLRNVQ